MIELKNSRLHSTLLAVGLLLCAVPASVCAQTEQPNTPTAEQSAPTPEQIQAEAEKYADEQIAEIATFPTSIRSVAGAAAEVNVVRGISEQRSDVGFVIQPDTEQLKAEQIQAKKVAAERVAQAKKFAAEVSDGTEAGKKKLVTAVRSMNGSPLGPRTPGTRSKGFDPAEMWLAIGKMVSDVYAIQQQYERGEITMDQRDLEQGVVVAKVAGYYGGRAVGGIIGAYVGWRMAGPPGAKIGYEAGKKAGGPAGEESAGFLARTFDVATRVVVRTAHGVYWVVSYPFRD